MLYKTMVLERLQQRPQMHEQLRRQRRLLALVAQLRTRTIGFPEVFQRKKPRSSLQKVIGAQALRQLQFVTGHALG